ncbi:UNVERIFIED_CONTAM: hypothetical protein GTU68_054426 [Idotea baltica]|nr:hypothetical protein [Idotea baltica]
MERKRAEERAELLTEALPYIRRFAGGVVVIKFGGSILEDEELCERFAKDVVLLRYVGILPVVVHGGGKEITRWLEKIGKETSFIDGLRYTDAETMEVTEMVLSGKVNSALVSLINKSGGLAVGLNGRDANLLTGRKMTVSPDKDYGFVGEVESCNTDLIKGLLEHGYIPVISSISETPAGQRLNINADAAASSLAVALGALKLIYMTDVDGLSVDGQLVSEMEFAEAEALLSHKDVSGGMRPKLENAIEAVRGRVEHVHILNGTRSHAILLELFTDEGIGSKLSYAKR